MLKKIVKVSIAVVLIASAIETVAAAWTTTLLLIPWSGGTDGVKATGFALLHGGVVSSLCATVLAWINRDEIKK